ncbi:MAG: hypothetical protein GWN37_12225, partial [Gammaproteobacteria bacterium]|nr:hypothetical protein [Gammaproteobacteria bacterium]
EAVGKLSLYGNELGRMIIEDEREDVGAFSCGEPMVFQMLSETPEGQSYVV